MRLTRKYPQRHGRGPTHDAGICIEVLEPRLLLSGSWGAGGEAPSAVNPAEVAITGDAGFSKSSVLNRNQNAADIESQVDILAGASALNISAVGEAANLDQAPPADDPASEIQNQASGRELILINSNLADLDGLIADLQNSDGSRSVEVVILDADREGIAQVGAILAGRSELTAVHVITHGAEGQIQLGRDWLNSATLGGNHDAVAVWGDALTNTGDILFYGCNIAADNA